MKLLVVLAALIAWCAANAIPLVPGDNSNYVGGESRYIWMPNGKGVPQLVDLQASIDETLLKNRNGANNQYLLYTRSNPSNPQVIRHGFANDVLNSNYLASRPLKVIVHGIGGNANSRMNGLIVSSFLNIADVNVIVVDWSALASSLYVVAAAGVPSVGQFVGNFLVWLFMTTGGSWNNVHLVGHGLGAHIVGYAGRVAGGQIARITGLDPAGPLWGNNANALNPNDGQYVEAIHTDGGLIGIFDPIGTANFYPNGGRNPQPGCWISTCSHERAIDLFAASVQINHFVGRLCSNLNEAQNNQCSGSTLNMGNGIVTKRGSGIYGLITYNTWPY